MAATGPARLKKQRVTSVVVAGGGRLRRRPTLRAVFSTGQAPSQPCSAWPGACPVEKTARNVGRRRRRRPPATTTDVTRCFFNRAGPVAAMLGVAGGLLA